MSDDVSGDVSGDVMSGFRPGDRVRHRIQGWTGTVSTYVRVQTDEESEWEGGIGTWAARNLEAIGAAPELWTVEQKDALHSLRQALGMPTPSEPLAVLEMAVAEVVGLLDESDAEPDEMVWPDDPRWQS